MHIFEKMVKNEGCSIQKKNFLNDSHIYWASESEKSRAKSLLNVKNKPFEYRWVIRQKISFDKLWHDK